MAELAAILNYNTWRHGSSSGALLPYNVIDVTTACKRRGYGGGRHAASWRSASYRRGSRGHCANRRSEVWAYRPRCICTGAVSEMKLVTSLNEYLTVLFLFFTDRYKGSVFTSSFGHFVSQYYKPQLQLAAWIDFHEIWNEGTTYRAIVY